MPRKEGDYRGRFITGATYPSADPRKAAIKKGAFLTSDPQQPAIVKRAPLPADLAEFEAAAAEADRLAASGLDEIRLRLAKAQNMLDQLRAAARRK